MYTLSSWRSHLGSVGVDFLYKEPAKTVADPFTAYYPGEVTEDSRMANVQPKFHEKYLSIVAVDLLHEAAVTTFGDPFTTYVPGEVTQVPSMTNVHPKFLEKSPR